MRLGRGAAETTKRGEGVQDGTRRDEETTGEDAAGRAGIGAPGGRVRVIPG